MVYCTFIWWFQKFSLFLQKSLLCQTMELMDIMKQRRETLALTQQDLAEMSQVGLATIKDIERGKGNPALNTVKKILDVLGIEIEYRIRKTV
jgi:toxin-antitoxin system, antitoxin component, xre family